MANSCDNNGLLAGNWSGNYDGGKKPWQWTGSGGIFKKYLESGTSVKFGQCWVFSGVLTSMMRCLGIPCRSVTNYDSAHDSDNNCTNDKYFDEDLNYLEGESDDSVWNFHVWNDVWMCRTDLPPGMGGWQAVDGTPQEESNGLYQCGPASLQAIKEGKIELPYDGRFVFAEVNADTVYWQKTSDNNVTPLRVKSNSIGTAILTKKPNVLEIEDVTSQYKYEEGSMLERSVVRNVMKKVKNPVVQNQPKDVEFKCRVPWNQDDQEDCTLEVEAWNKKANALTVSCAIVAHVVRYTGVKLKTLNTVKLQQQVQSRDEHTFEFKFSNEEFAEFVDENVSLRFSVMAKVMETNQVYITQKMCNINKPELLLETSATDNEVCSGDELKVTIQLPRRQETTQQQQFTGCSLDVECPLLKETSITLSDCEVNDGNGFIEKTFKIKNIMKEREVDLNISFNSNEISGVHGSLTLKAVASTSSNTKQ